MGSSAYIHHIRSTSTAYSLLPAGFGDLQALLMASEAFVLASPEVEGEAPEAPVYVQ